jgi:EAL and modified HD-GYP domain-containing signal transduction protein
VLSADRPGIRADVAFTAGLLSALDLLLGASREDLAARLQISEDLRRAAFEHTGPLGALVEEVIDLEQALDTGRPADPRLMAAAAEAFTWALAHLEALDGAGG